MLQWSRAVLSAECQPELKGGVWQFVASMEPRRVERGMTPPPAGSRLSRSRLQWSRAVLSAECFASIDLPTISLCASMEPRRVERGMETAVRRVNAVTEGFNGAAPC